MYHIAVAFLVQLATYEKKALVFKVVSSPCVLEQEGKGKKRLSREAGLRASVFTSPKWISLCLFALLMLSQC